VVHSKDKEGYGGKPHLKSVTIDNGVVFVRAFRLNRKASKKLLQDFKKKYLTEFSD